MSDRPSWARVFSRPWWGEIGEYLRTCGGVAPLPQVGDGVSTALEMAGVEVSAETVKRAVRELADVGLVRVVPPAKPWKRRPSGPAADEVASVRVTALGVCCGGRLPGWGDSEGWRSLLFEEVA